MEKEGPDDWAKNDLEFIVGLKALHDVLEERFNICWGKLVGGRGGRGKERSRERGKRQERAKEFRRSNLTPETFRQRNRKR